MENDTSLSIGILIGTLLTLALLYTSPWWIDVEDCPTCEECADCTNFVVSVNISNETTNPVPIHIDYESCSCVLDELRDVITCSCQDDTTKNKPNKTRLS